MRFIRGAVLVVVASATVACPGRNPITGSSSSSGGSSSSGQTSSSSSGMVPVGDPVPLDRLCASLASGYGRVLVAYEYGFAFALGDVQACSAAPDDVVVESVVGDTAELASALCTAADGGGLMFAAAQAISASEQAGRVRYHADRAGACIAVGRAAITASGGLLSVFNPRDG